MRPLGKRERLWLLAADTVYLAVRVTHRTRWWQPPWKLWLWTLGRAFCASGAGPEDGSVPAPR